MYAASQHLMSLIAYINNVLMHVKEIAEHRWHILLNHIVAKITCRPLPICARILNLEAG